MDHLDKLIWLPAHRRPRRQGLENRHEKQMKPMKTNEQTSKACIVVIYFTQRVVDTHSTPVSPFCHLPNLTTQQFQETLYSLLKKHLNHFHLLRNCV
jgi:hypothetical protein